MDMPPMMVPSSVNININIREGEQTKIQSRLI